MGKHSPGEPRHQRDPKQPKFETLLVGHDPRDPAEATLVLGAVAALRGFGCDGIPMTDGIATTGRLPLQSEIAIELGLHVGAVRRGIAHLKARGILWPGQGGGFDVDPDALRDRWAPHRQRIRLSRDVRMLSMRPGPMLLAGLVAGGQDKLGRLCLGVAYLSERTGLSLRQVERGLGRCRDAGAIHTWSVPIPGPGFRRQLFLALGSRTGGSDRSRTGGSDRDDAAAATSAEPTTSRIGGQHVANRRSARRESVVSTSRIGGRLPEYSTEYATDSPSEAPPAAEGETTARLSKAEAKQIIERWVQAFRKRGIETLTEKHAVEVAGLIDQLGPSLIIRDPNPIKEARRRSALRTNRLELARLVIRRHGSPERLCRWLSKALGMFRVKNLAGYLRRSCERNDPGTMDAHMRNRFGKAAETWQDFSPATERALEGEHVKDVQRIVAGGAELMAITDPLERNMMRNELRLMLKSGRFVDARAVILKLVGQSNPSDITLQAAIGEACTLQQAREVLAA